MSAEGPLVVLVEDDPRMSAFLRTLLFSHDHRLIVTSTCREALAMISSHAPDLVLLDLGLPDGDGLEVLRRLREWTSVPVIVLSARDREGDKVSALDGGADDYVTKPFGALELLARMRAALRGARPQLESAVMDFDDLHIDLTTRRVVANGAEVHLTPIELKLLGLLARHAGKVLTHQQILKEVWGPNAVDKPHYVRVHMAQLRRKIERDPARPRHIVTETGVGYRLLVPDTA